MPLNYLNGGIEYALRAIESEGPKNLTNYEKMQLAIELVKASAVQDVANSLGKISETLVGISK